MDGAVRLCFACREKVSAKRQDIPLVCTDRFSERRNAMEIFRRNRVRFIAVNNGIDSEKPDTLEFAPFINIMSEWYAKDISKIVKTGIKTKGMNQHHEKRFPINGKSLFAFSEGGL